MRPSNQSHSINWQDVPALGQLTKDGMARQNSAQEASFSQRPSRHFHDALRLVLRQWRTKRWRWDEHFPIDRLLAVGAVLTAVAWLGSKALTSPDARSGIAWAVRTWFRPPDAEAEWEQQRG